jgi:hypothetical protein
VQGVAQEERPFKTFFAAEYHDMKEQQRVNVSQSNFHGANNMMETDITSALDNLAMAATNDRDVVNMLTKNNEVLVSANKMLVEQLKAALELVKTVAKKGGTGTGTDRPPRERKPRMTNAEFEAALDPNGYCYEHGYRVTKGHTSKKCGGKRPGHKDEATRSNNMGGSQNNKPE